MNQVRSDIVPTIHLQSTSWLQSSVAIQVFKHFSRAAPCKMHCCNFYRSKEVTQLSNRILVSESLQLANQSNLVKRQSWPQLPPGSKRTPRLQTFFFNGNVLPSQMGDILNPQSNLSSTSSTYILSGLLDCIHSKTASRFRSSTRKSTRKSTNTRAPQVPRDILKL